MAGELWRSTAQVGKETVPGTAVAATRKVYYRSVTGLGSGAETRYRRFQTGTRDNQRAASRGVKAPGGQLVQELSADEIIELLLTSIQGGVAPTTPSAGVYLWTFKPGSSNPDTFTLEANDGARGWQEKGCLINQLRIAGNAKGENLVTADLLSRDFVQNALTNGLSDRTPSVIEGWESKLYVDAFGGTPGTTVLAGTLINWDVTINNQANRKHWGDNTQAVGDVVMGELAVEATITFEGAPAAALTEWSNSEAGTKRLVRLEFGQNDVIASTYKRFVTIDIPGAWGVVALDQADDGTRAYQFRFSTVYDPTNAYGLQVRAQNARSAAWT